MRTSKLTLWAAGITLTLSPLVVGAAKLSDPVPVPPELTISRVEYATCIEEQERDLELAQVRAFLAHERLNGLDLADFDRVEARLKSRFDNVNRRDGETEYYWVEVEDEWVRVCRLDNRLVLGDGPNPIVLNLRSSMRLP